MTNTNATTSSPPTLLGTGIEGLDDILHGGFSAGGLYSIEGDTGAGKTTLCLQFLLEGVRQGEPVLVVTLSESATDLRTMARSHGWNLDGIEILELIASDRAPSPPRHLVARAGGDWGGEGGRGADRCGPGLAPAPPHQVFPPGGGGAGNHLAV